MKAKTLLWACGLVPGLVCAAVTTTVDHPAAARAVQLLVGRAGGRALAADGADLI